MGIIILLKELGQQPCERVPTPKSNFNSKDIWLWSIYLQRRMHSRMLNASGMYTYVIPTHVAVNRNLAQVLITEEVSSYTRVFFVSQ